MQRILRRQQDSSSQETTEHSTVPAGQEPTDPSAGPSPDPGFRERGSLRRRLRYLRRARELGYRDLGGLVFDLRRFERERPDLVDAKIAALVAVDEELRTLEGVLGDRQAITELREPGISACARCGALHPSEANFCPNCGLTLHGGITPPEAAQPQAAAESPKADAPQAEPAAEAPAQPPIPDPHTTAVPPTSPGSEAWQSFGRPPGEREGG